MTPIYDRVPIGRLSPNPWNVNKLDGEMYEKARASIRRFGFIDPVTVRDIEADGIQIIDGEQRWRAAIDEGLEEIDVADLGSMPDETAQQLSIILNELHGTYDPRDMGSLLTRLMAAEPLPALAEVLPFTMEQIEELTALPKVDWNTVTPRPPATRSERWVERVYRMPSEAAEIIDAAIERARGMGFKSDWAALQRFAQEWMDSS